MSTLEQWLEAKSKRRAGIAKRKVTGPASINEDAAEMKAEMKEGFHPICKARDVHCGDCQNFYGRYRKAGIYADHTIIQKNCSKEERLDPRFGMGICAECNKLRDQKLHGAAILESAELFYQVRWHTETGACVRRLMSDPPGAWFAWDKPEWMKDSHRYSE
jgi:hypothetical protein